MINEYKAKRYCKEEISKIENYEQAVKAVGNLFFGYRNLFKFKKGYRKMAILAQIPYIL